MAGIRGITYFEDNVRDLSKIIERKFDIDTTNSLNKRDLLVPDRFGYLSLHYVVKLSASRLALTEYRAFHSLKAELQIRSVLQHAWAEIEHDLGYHAEREIPREVRRRFSRLAGILELVDQEFIGIRSDLRAYSEKLETTISCAPEDIELDNNSLAVYISSSAILRQIDRAISKAIGIKLVEEQEEQLFGSVYEGWVKYCISVGLTTIGELGRALKENEELIIWFSREYDRVYPTGQKEGHTITPGAAIYYLCLVIITKTGDLAKIKEFVHLHSQFRRFEKREQFAEFLQRTLSGASDRINTE